MADDLGTSLSAIKARYRRPLVSLLLDIQRTQIKNLKSMEFMERLTCLCPLELERELSTTPSNIPANTFTKKRINAFQERNYVAISCTWEPASRSDEAKGNYYLQIADGVLVQSDVRDSVFERIKKYMMRFNLRYLWIDRECIKQVDGEEKKTAIQAMDLVYHCSRHPLGLLYRPIASIRELELLVMLLEYGAPPRPSFKIPDTMACEILALLNTIVSDVWWTRAWIYQENYRGGIDMQLLIPHHIRPEDDPNGYLSSFGDVPGEIILASTIFHKAATTFCLDFNPPSHLHAAKTLVLERAARFSVLLERLNPDGLRLATRSMSPSIIADLQKRKLSKPWDRLAIIANCCQYPVRLDDTQLAEKGHSLSLSILALFLLSGEILHNNNNEFNIRSRAPGTQTITEFLTTHAFARFSPPSPLGGLTYNKSSRFIDASFSSEGLLTHGHLWKLGRRAMTFPPFLFPYSRFPLRRADEIHILETLHGQIPRNTALSLALHEFIAFFASVAEPDSDDDVTFARSYQCCMAEILAEGIAGGKMVRLGELVDGRCRGGVGGGVPPYRGIFICEAEDDGDDGPEYVFTALREREREMDDEMESVNDVDRHVSLGVDVDLDSDLDLDWGSGGVGRRRRRRRRRPALRTKGWVHGLCFFQGCERVEVVFPWPEGILGI